MEHQKAEAGHRDKTKTYENESVSIQYKNMGKDETFLSGMSKNQAIK